MVYSTKDEDLQFGKILVRPSVKRAKIISVAFQNRDIVIAGCTDSTIRAYDVRNGSNLRNMSIGAGPKGGPKNIDIWAVRALPNGDIISGDSTGEMRIWSGKTYTLMQRVKSHNADIFTLAASHDGSTIFSGGKDRRTVVYKQAGKAKRWAEVSHRRYHDHDVTTMASLEYKGMSVMVSGGEIAFRISKTLANIYRTRCLTNRCSSPTIRHGFPKSTPFSSTGCASKECIDGQETTSHELLG